MGKLFPPDDALQAADKAEGDAGPGNEGSVAVVEAGGAVVLPQMPDVPVEILGKLLLLMTDIPDGAVELGGGLDIGVLVTHRGRYRRRRR